MRTGIRTILVPPDIVAVQRRSPLPVKKRTPWRPRPEGEVRTERAGAREWFSDGLFVETEQGHRRVGLWTSIALHAGCGVALIVVLAAQSSQTLPVQVGVSTVMPATMSLLAFANEGPRPSRSVEPSVPKATPKSPAAAPAAAAGPIAPAPVDAPSGIEPETGAEGVSNGVEGGIAGELLDGTLSPGPSSPGPARLGGSGGVKPPRKIKDVTPVYPQDALSAEARGTVVIEATIGVDGTVQDATVLHSVAGLDQAALDAVRQWVYTPSLLNGAPVAVIMTVIVNFAIQ